MRQRPALPRRTEESGDVIVAGLLKVVLALLAIGLVVYEVGAITVNQVQLDDLASRAVRTGAATAPQQRTPATVERAVLATLEGTGARLESLDVAQDGVTLTISRPARVLVVHRLGPLADLAEAARTKRAAFR